jgi:FdhE protein
MTDVWERRLRRAEELERLWPHSAEILRFFRAVTAFQSKFSGEDSLDELVSKVPHLLDVFEREGPRDLARLAGRARERSAEEWLETLKPVLAARNPDNTFESLCMRCVVQPGCILQAAALQTRLPTAEPAAPGVGVLREDREAETLRRSLVCWRCSSEWDFPRVVCPACGEEKPEKLPRFTAQEIPWIRVEACDSCGKYLKAIDLTKEPAAEPVVDELASTPLDLLARERGYEKIAPNLAGL